MEKVVVSLFKYTFTPNDYLTGEASNAEVLLEKQAVKLGKGFGYFRHIQNCISKRCFDK